MTLRVTGGTLRGRKVALPRHPLRPTSERARQAFFDIAGPRVAGARFLDLFAGTGIFAIEALSRGAESAVAIDTSREAVRVLEKLAGEWNLPLIAMKGDALSTIDLLAGSEPFTLVYADPPYDYGEYEALVDRIGTTLPLETTALVAIEHETRNQIETSDTGRLIYRRTARYGRISIALWECTDE